MSRTSAFTRTDQKFLSFALSSLWNFIPGLAGLSCRSKAVVLTAFCSSPVRRARLSVKVSAIRKFMRETISDVWAILHFLVGVNRRGLIASGKWRDDIEAAV